MVVTADVDVDVGVGVEVMDGETRHLEHGVGGALVIALMTAIATAAVAGIMEAEAAATGIGGNYVE